ncbi:MAG: hypothetical protein K1X83_05420 [Oligoflexia bacterium]|nr:hypothetical protein [Oligoflexia bacterium]
MDGFLQSLLAILVFTGFVKIFTALCIARYGLGLDQAGFGIVIGVLALALSIFAVEPQLRPYGGWSILNGGENQKVDLPRTFTPFLVKHSDAKIISELEKLRPNSEGQKNDTPEFSLLTVSFLLSELKSAFEIGLLLLIPLIIIDLLTSNILMALGMQQLSPALVSLPIKLLLFLALDGWTLFSEKLLNSYTGAG